MILILVVIALVIYEFFSVETEDPNYIPSYDPDID